MEFTKALIFTARLWLAIFLTMHGPITAFAQKSCHSLFSAEYSSATLTPKKTVIKLSEAQEAANQFWQSRFSKIKSVKELELILNSVEASISNFSNFDLSALHKIDMINAVRQLPKSDLSRMKEIVAGAASRVLNSRPLSPVDVWLYPLDFYFNPQNILLFFKQFKNVSEHGLNFADAYSGIYGLRSFNQTLSRAIEKLPLEIQQQAQAEIKMQMSTIRLNEELMSMENGKLQIPNSRLYRRNLETIASMLARGNFEILKKKFEKLGVESRIELIAAVDEYYLQLGKSLTPERGRYSFAKVLQAAEIVQSAFYEFLKTDEQFITIYGSFPNGKAALKVSDIDIKLSTDLLLAQTNKTEAEIINSPFSLLFSNMVESEINTLPNNFFKFWGKYKQAEVELGKKIFNRLPTQPSELMTTLYPPRDYSHNSFDVRWYNPLVLKINRDHIVLQLSDLSGDLSLFEVPVPLR